MDNQGNALLNWAYYCQDKTMEELRKSLLYTTQELEQANILAREELRKKDEQLFHLKDLLTRTVKERDEALEKPYPTMEELKQSLLYTTLELEQTKMVAQEELRKKDEHLIHLKDVLTRTVKERDEALEKFKFFL